MHGTKMVTKLKNKNPEIAFMKISNLLKEKV